MTVTRVSRLLVLATAAVTAFLALPALPPLSGWGFVLLVLLVVLDVALVARTGAFAFLPGNRLDERLLAARDHAYRGAFRVVGIVLLLILVVRFTPLSMLGQGNGLAQYDTVWDGVSPRLLVAIIEALSITPSLVLAWRGIGEPPASPSAWDLAKTAAAPILAVAVLVVGWAVLVGAAPPRVLNQVDRSVSRTMVTDATCAHFTSIRDTAFGLGGVVRLRSEVCWNGRVAFVFGAGPVLPPPPGAPSYLGAPSLPDLMNCGPDLDQQDLVRITDVRCSAVIGADGTLHYIASGHLYPTPMAIGGRDIRMEIVVRPDGRVLTFS